MNCSIIKDLMVLYASGECSDESKAAILEHIKTCPGCREIWETIETGELEHAVEEEKETEFQQVTKAIKKRNWRKIMKRTVVCTVALGVVLFAIGIMYVRWDNAGSDDVITGEIVYWNEDDQRENKDVVFQYGGQDYIHLDSDEDIGLALFDGKARAYLRFSTDWEELLQDRGRAAFNVQSEWASPWANLMLDNNRVTMYNTGSHLEENMYIDTRECELYLPPASKEKVLAYYNDEANYTWTLSEFIDVPMTDPNPAKNSKEREDLDVGFTPEDVNALTKMFASEKETKINSERIRNLYYVNLHMESKDGVMGVHMSVENINGEWYIIGEEEQTGPNEYYWTSLKLPKSIGDKIDKAINTEW